MPSPSPRELLRQAIEGGNAEEIRAALDFVIVMNPPFTREEEDKLLGMIRANNNPKRGELVIKPTIGRVVWYYDRGKMQHDLGEQPYPALVAYVHSDRLVNLGYFDSNGVARSQTSVALLQEGDPIPEVGFFACWMPYQQAQAKAAS